VTDPDQPVTVVEDAPQPDLSDLQQREVFDGPAVRVCVDGSTDVHTLPNRGFSTSIEPIGSNGVRILFADPRRRKATIILRSATATDFFYVSASQSGQGVPWPANVPMVHDHCDEVWAKEGTPAAPSLSVLYETWAD